MFRNFYESRSIALITVTNCICFWAHDFKTIPSGAEKILSKYISVQYIVGIAIYSSLSNHRSILKPFIVNQNLYGHNRRTRIYNIHMRVRDNYVYLQICVCMTNKWPLCPITHQNVVYPSNDPHKKIRSIRNPVYTPWCGQTHKKNHPNNNNTVSSKDNNTARNMKFWSKGVTDVILMPGVCVLAASHSTYGYRVNDLSLTYTIILANV